MNPKNIPGEKSKHKRLYTILVHLYEILGKKHKKTIVTERGSVVT